MESLSNEQWHKAQNERLSRIATEMGRLFTPGHDVLQTPEYEAVRKDYLQSMCDQRWHDYCMPPLEKSHLACG